jgi:hypothetical protein
VFFWPGSSPSQSIVTSCFAQAFSNKPLNRCNFQPSVPLRPSWRTWFTRTVIGIPSPGLMIKNRDEKTADLRRIVFWS